MSRMLENRNHGYEPAVTAATDPPPESPLPKKLHICRHLKVSLSLGCLALICVCLIHKRCGIILDLFLSEPMFCPGCWKRFFPSGTCCRIWLHKFDYSHCTYFLLKVICKKVELDCSKANFSILDFCDIRVNKIIYI